MSAKSSATALERSPRAVAWWADRFHRYVLPVAGAISVTLGVSLAVGARFPWDAYLPLVLVVLGVGVLASVLARYGTGTVPPTVAPAPSERFIADTLVICPSCSARSFEAVSSASPHPSAWRVPDPSRGAFAPGSSELLTANPGDFLWGSWLPGTGRLPVELVGPVPETVYVPPRPGTPTLYEESEPVFVGGPPAGGTRGTPSGSTVPGSPSLSARSWTVTEIVEPESDLPTSLAGWKGVGSATLDYPIADPLLQEALNPIPPHLRTGSTPANPAPPVPPPRPWEPGHPGLCADCSDPVPDLANWRRCSDCHHLLCAGCMVSALLTRERAWCAHCAELRILTAQ